MTQTPALQQHGSGSENKKNAEAAPTSAGFVYSKYHSSDSNKHRPYNAEIQQRIQKKYATESVAHLLFIPATA